MPGYGRSAARAPAKRPAPLLIIDRCGRAWEIFPWIGVVLGIFEFLASRAPLPDWGIPVLGICLLIWVPCYIFWIIVDVLALGNPWWWILLGILCYPIGLVIYRTQGRT